MSSWIGEKTKLFTAQEAAIWIADSNGVGLNYSTDTRRFGGLKSDGQTWHDAHGIDLYYNHYSLVNHTKDELLKAAATRADRINLDQFLSILENAESLAAAEKRRILQVGAMAISLTASDPRPSVPANANSAAPKGLELKK